MRFPESQRVKYSNNPLVEVICQLRFPRILKIETEAPSSFQEEIRGEYPLYTQCRSVEVNYPSDLLSGQPPRVLEGGISHEFEDQKKEWKLVLTGSFIAVSTSKYSQWEEFSSKVSQAINALVKYYSPVYFERVGLRYQDLIVRSELGLKNAAWRELFRAPILGIFSDETMPEEDFSELLSTFACKLDYSDAILKARCGLVRKKESNELSYLIDADFFRREITEIVDASNLLDQFNREAGRFFRWCIKERLQRVLQPTSIS